MNIVTYTRTVTSDNKIHFGLLQHSHEMVAPTLKADKSNMCVTTRKMGNECFNLLFPSSNPI